MNNRQKRLCRALLDYYDESGAQPFPLAQLARKTGYDASDIYDKDSQSGDLWPFDSKARGNLAGMLSFTSGKNPTVTITSAGLVGLENLCKDEKPKPKEEPAVVAEEIITKPLPPVPAPEEKVDVSPKIVSPPIRRHTALPKPVPSRAKNFSAEEITEAKSRFNQWLKSDEARTLLFDQLKDDKLVEAALEKFFDEFLQGKDA